MPQIRPYESQVGSQGEMPNQSAQLQDFGGAGLSNLGQGVENLGQSVGQAQRILNQAKSRMEVTDEHVAYIGSVERLTAQVAEHEKTYVAIDPATGRRNPTLSEKMPGLVKAELDQRGLTADGSSVYETQPAQNAFSVNAAQLSQHFVDVARHVDARLAGEAAVNTVNSITDQLGAHVFAHPVPATVDFAMQKAQQFIRDPNGAFADLPVQHQDKLLRGMQESIATRAVEGAIRQYPNRALQILQQPPDQREAQYDYIAKYVPNEKINTLLNRAETEVRGQQVDAERAQADDNRQRITLAREAESSLIEKLALHMSDAKQPMPSARDVLDSSLTTLDPEKGKAMLGLIHAWSKEDPSRPVHTNPVVAQQLFSRIHLPDGDPKKMVDTAPIYTAYEKSQLNFEDMNRLRRELVESRTPEGSDFGREKADFLKGIEPQITKPGPFGIYTDATTPEKFATFKRELETAIAQYRKDGKNPRALFDENSKDYFGKVAKSSKYQSTGFGSTAAQPAAPVSPAAPKKSLAEIFGIKP